MSIRITRFHENGFIPITNGVFVFIYGKENLVLLNHRISNELSEVCDIPCYTALLHEGATVYNRYYNGNNKLLLKDNKFISIRNKEKYPISIFIPNNTLEKYVTNIHKVRFDWSFEDSNNVDLYSKRKGYKIN